MVSCSFRKTLKEETTMAKLAKGSPLEGIRGELAGLLFREVDGETVVSGMPSPPKKTDESIRQRETRERFRKATEFAHAMMRDAARKKYYAKKAKQGKVKLPNAYTAAIADYMRKTDVASVNLESYTGNVGGRVVIKAERQDFGISEMVVTVMTKGGQAIETGKAVQYGSGAWIYKNKVKTDGVGDLRFVVDAVDTLGKKTQAVQEWGDGLRCSYWWIEPPAKGQRVIN